MNDQPDSEQWDSGQINLQEFVATVRKYWLLLVIIPVIAGALAYLVTSTLPGKYTSIAYLRIDRATERSAEALMTSPEIADKVLADDATAGATTEARISFLSESMKLKDTNPRGDERVPRIYRLTVTHTDAKRAQQIAVKLIDSWLNTTVPGVVERKALEAEIERDKSAVESITKLIERLQNEAIHLLVPNSLAGEIASPISALLTKRSETITRIADLERRLDGVPHDVVVGKPHLPEETTWPRKGQISMLSAAGFFIAILIIMMIAPPLKRLVSRSAAESNLVNPNDAAKEATAIIQELRRLRGSL
jgi:uncharacterized protein involved in exopolysaccharide biosynthesis